MEYFPAIFLFGSVFYEFSNALDIYIFKYLFFFVSGLDIYTLYPSALERWQISVRRQLCQKHRLAKPLTAKIMGAWLVNYLPHSISFSVQAE